MNVVCVIVCSNYIQKVEHGHDGLLFQDDSRRVVWCCCCLPTPMTLASGGESDVPACGPPASFSVHLASSAVTPAGSVHKSRGDNVVRMCAQLKR